jgi:hypothetical protein
VRHCHFMVAALALSLVVSATPADEATAAFKRGRELMSKGRLAAACAAFDESHRLDPALGALLNLAECTYKLDQHARAWAVYGEVLAWANRTANQARVRVAEERLASLRPKVALVVIDAPLTDDVLVDRQRVVAGQTLALDPGAHVVEFKRAGADTEMRTVTVSGGETLTLSRTVKEDEPRRLEPAPEPEPVFTATPAAATLSVTAPAPPPVTGSRAGPLGLLIAGGVLSAASLVTFGYATDVWNRAEAQRQGNALTVTRREYEVAGQLYPVSVGGLIAGPVLLAVGALWWLLTN